MDPRSLKELVILEDPPIVAKIAKIPVPIVTARHQFGLFTLEKFIKNGAKALKGTIEPEKGEAWTLNILKTFKAVEVPGIHHVEVPGIHQVKVASYMLDEEAAFWWEAVQRTNFVWRQLDTISWVEFIDVFNNTNNLEQVHEQKAREFKNLKQDKDHMGR